MDDAARRTIIRIGKMAAKNERPEQVPKNATILMTGHSHVREREICTLYT